MMWRKTSESPFNGLFRSGYHSPVDVFHWKRTWRACMIHPETPLALPTTSIKALIFGIMRMFSFESIPYTFDCCYHWGSESPLTFLTCRPLTTYRLGLFLTGSDRSFGMVWQSDLLSCLSPKSEARVIKCKINRVVCSGAKNFLRTGIFQCQRSVHLSGIISRLFGLWKVRQISGS